MEEKRRKENEKLKEEECEVCFQNIVRKNEEIWKTNKKIKEMIVLIQNIEKNLQLQKQLEKVGQNQVYMYSENSGIYNINEKEFGYDLVENYYRQKLHKKIECCNIKLCIQCKYEWYCEDNCSVCQKQYKNFEQFRILNIQIIKKKVNIIDQIPELKQKKQEYGPLLRLYSVQNMDSEKGNLIEQEFYNNKNGLSIITCKKKQKRLQFQDSNKEVKEGTQEILGKDIVKIFHKKKMWNFFDGKQVREFKKNMDIESWDQEYMQQYNLQSRRDYQRRNSKLIFIILVLFLVVITGMLTIAIMELRRNTKY